jgi:Leucine rich repeat
MRIVAIKVNHLENHGNADVKVIMINHEHTTYLPQGLGAFFTSIQELYVMSSELRYISRNYFKGIEKLTSISFYNNKIEELPDDVFFDLTELRFLSLFINKIERIPLLLLRNSRKLEDISFRANFIEHVPSFVFENNKKLKGISFYENRIVMFSADLILNLPNLGWLDLRENPCIDEEFYFEIGDFKNSSYQSVLETCGKEIYRDNTLSQECDIELIQCKTKVKNGWRENEKLKEL